MTASGPPRHIAPPHGLVIAAKPGRVPLNLVVQRGRLSLARILLQQNRQIERAAEIESVPAHAGGIR